jgi:hypothetical protein
MRLKHTVQVQLTQDAAGKRKLYSDDATSATTDTQAWTAMASGSFSINPAATEPLAFGDVGLVRGVYLEMDQEGTVQVNGGTPLQLRKAADAPKAKLFLEAELTQIAVSNPSTSVLTGVFVLWGSPST